MKKKNAAKIGVVLATLFLVTVASTTVPPTKAAVTLNSQLPPSNTVIIALEDGWYDQYMNAVPILNQLGFKATFDVYTMGIDTGHTDGHLWMDWGNIASLQDSGYDIESLTVEHLDLNTLTNSALNSELVDSKNEFLTHDIQVGDLTLPYDTPTNGTVVSAISAVGYVTIRGNTAVYSLENGTAVKLPVNVYYPTDNTTPAYLNSNLNGTVTLLLYHHIDTNSSDPAAVSPTMFAEQMQLLKANGYHVETFSQAFFTETPYDSPLPTATPYPLFANVNVMGVAVLIVFAVVVAGTVCAVAIRRRRHRNEN